MTKNWLVASSECISSLNTNGYAQFLSPQEHIVNLHAGK